MDCNDRVNWSTDTQQDAGTRRVTNHTSYKHYEEKGMTKNQARIQDYFFGWAHKINHKKYR